jgi:hypothetical protein
MKRNILCKIFGHLYYQGIITLALSLTDKKGTWHKVTHASETTVCKRCGSLPIIGMITIGDYDTNIGFSPQYSIDAIRVFMDKKLESGVIPFGQDVFEQ